MSITSLGNQQTSASREAGKLVQKPGLTHRQKDRCCLWISVLIAAYTSSNSNGAIVILRHEKAEQAVAVYDPQVVAMHTLPLAARLSSTARGSCLNRDVGHMNNRLPHVHWTFHIDNAKKSDHTVTLRTMGQSRTAENQMNSPTRRSTVRRTRRRR